MTVEWKTGHISQRLHTTIKFGICAPVTVSRMTYFSCCCSLVDRFLPFSELTNFMARVFVLSLYGRAFFGLIIVVCKACSLVFTRLKDETTVCKIIEDLETYLRLQGQVTDEELCRVYLKRIQHIYYKACVAL